MPTAAQPVAASDRVRSSGTGPGGSAGACRPDDGTRWEFEGDSSEIRHLTPADVIACCPPLGRSGNSSASARAARAAD
jgi:hypothetical protein